MQHHHAVDTELLAMILRGHNDIGLSKVQIDAIVQVIKTSFPDATKKRILLVDDDDEEEEVIRPSSKNNNNKKRRILEEEDDEEEEKKEEKKTVPVRVLRPRPPKIVVPDSDSDSDEDSMYKFIADDDEEEEEDDIVDDDDDTNEKEEEEEESVIRKKGLNLHEFEVQMWGGMGYENIITSDLYKKTIEPSIKGFVGNWGNQSHKGVMDFQKMFLRAMLRPDTDLSDSTSHAPILGKCACCGQCRSLTKSIRMYTDEKSHVSYYFGSFCYERLIAVAEIYNLLLEIAGDSGGFSIFTSERAYNPPILEGTSKEAFDKLKKLLMNAQSKQQKNRFFNK